MINEYKAECKVIEEHCTYSSETHHIIANKQKRTAYSLQILPAVIAAITGSFALADIYPTLFGFLSVISASASAIANILNPFKSYQDNLSAAKSFTVLKHRARALRMTFSSRLNEVEFADKVEGLHQKYNDLVSITPITDKKSFDEARKRVKAGIHTPDCIESNSQTKENNKK